MSLWRQVKRHPPKNSTGRVCSCGTGPKSFLGGYLFLSQIIHKILFFLDCRETGSVVFRGVSLFSLISLDKILFFQTMGEGQSRFSRGGCFPLSKIDINFFRRQGTGRVVFRRVSFLSQIIHKILFFQTVERREASFSEGDPFFR